MVTFEPIENWVIGEDYVIKYVLPFELEDAGSDWIGIYKVLRYLFYYIPDIRS